MSKLSLKAKASKLNTGNVVNEVNQPQKQNKGGLVSKAKLSDHPRSYRLDAEILNALKMTLDKINEVSPKKVSESRLLKAIILIAQDLDEDLILKALKEVW